ncbi:hypothetical protein NL676_020008 [Syzygium grande]|nr:hypothetical protein NL676_020008 [Syzygium grande]
MITDRVLARLRGRTCDEQNPRLVRPDEIGKIGLFLSHSARCSSQSDILGPRLCWLKTPAPARPDLRTPDAEARAATKPSSFAGESAVGNAKGGSPKWETNAEREREREGEGEAERPRPGLAVDLAIAQIWATARSTAGHGKAEPDPPMKATEKSKNERDERRSELTWSRSERSSGRGFLLVGASERAAGFSRDGESFGDERQAGGCIVPDERDGQQSSE